MQKTKLRQPAPGLLLAGLTLSLLGCAKSKAPAAAAPSASECPQGQTFDGQFCQVTGAPPPEAPAAASSAAAEPDAPGTSPESTGSGGAGATAVVPATAVTDAPAPAPSLATPVDVSMAAQAGPLITYLAGSHLPPGARPFGAPFAAQFAEGQVFEQQVKLTLGKCYTVVAAGLPPVSELVLELHSVATTSVATTSVATTSVATKGAAATSAPAAGAALPPPLAVDAASGPQAVLGSRAACIKADRTDVWLLLRVSKGQGVVAGQVFEK